MTETFFITLITIIVSTYFKATEVKMLKDDGNQQVTNAGLIDGNGYFGITSKKYPCCEITLATKDLRTLKQIQNKFGGSVKFRSGSKSVRW
ncbi:hypothetical protein DAHU10_023460, partial (mitochondrion) [Hanseniaspora uvarum]